MKPIISAGSPAHPAQLYAVAVTLAIFAILWRRRSTRRCPGELAAMFLVLYPTFTFFHEFLRGDHTITWSPAESIVLTPNQTVSVLVLLTGLVLWCTLNPGKTRCPPLEVGSLPTAPGGVS